MQGDLISQAVSSLENALKKVKPEKSTAMKSVVVALYSAGSDGKLRYANFVGLLQLDTDRALKSKMLRIYDLETLALAFEIEIYYGLQNSLKIINETMLLIDYVHGSIAFLFRNKDEAEMMKFKIAGNCPSLQEFEAIKHRNIEAAKKKEEEKSLLGKFKNFFKGNEQQEERIESEVLNCTKESSIQVNLADGSFNTEKIPPEWQEMFDELKLSKEDLHNKQIMGVIFEETVLNQAKRQAEKQSNHDLQYKVQAAEHEGKKQHQDYIDQISRNTMFNLPPPPPPLPPLLTPPNARISALPNRANLMDEIRNHNIKLNHVNVNDAKGKAEMTIDISQMNKEERNDHIENLRLKLQQRKRALNRREADSDDD